MAPVRTGCMLPYSLFACFAIALYFILAMHDLPCRKTKGDIELVQFGVKEEKRKQAVFYIPLMSIASTFARNAQFCVAGVIPIQ